MRKTILLVAVSIFIAGASAVIAEDIIVDNPGATFAGSWATASASGQYGTNYRTSTISTTGGSTATYTPSIPSTSSGWQVFTLYPSVSKAYSATEFIIHHAAGNTTVNVNQTTNPASWVSLGTYTLNAGTANYVQITNRGTNTSKKAIADAVRFLLDTSAPVISNVASSPGTTTVTIAWATDEASTSQVEYGLTTSYGSQTTEDTTKVTSHSVTISGLTQGTLYHFRVKSTDASANQAVSGDYTFTTQSPPPEFRATWADTWHNGILSATEVTALVNTHASNNYNAIIAEVRKCGDAYYNSIYEPRATNIIDPLPFDPLQDLITKAHAAGLEVHPWIVAYRIWNSGWGNAPTTHYYTLHPDHVMVDVNGNNLESNYYNLDPGIPAVQDYICKVVMDIVNKYDIDGFNYDYIRYPGSTWGYNQITKDRFNAEYGYYPPTSSTDPNWGVWSDYRRRQVTDLVKKLYLNTMTAKPHVKMSVDTVGWLEGDPNVDFTGTRQYKDVFQDGKAWVEQHIVDMNVLMNYKREYDTAQKPDYRIWAQFIADNANTNGRHAIDGQAAYLNAIADSITQLQYDRSVGCHGNTTYSYAVTNKDGQPASSYWSAVKTNLYQTPVPTPDMPWKSNPTTGVLWGTVTNAAKPNDPIYQNWVYQATVTVTGPVTRSTQTDATGTYGFMDLPPGKYTITVSKTGLPSRTYESQSVAAGQFLRENFDLGYKNVASYYGVVAPGWNLVSLPYEPASTDPATVFSGITIDNRLFKWDNPSGSLKTYDLWDPGNFGTVSAEEGYWLYADTAQTIRYQAFASNAVTCDVQIPNTGWIIMGCPFLNQKAWANAEVTKNGETVSLATAANVRGWINSTGWWWDNASQSLIDLGLPEQFPTSDCLVPWYGYWIQSNTDGLTVTLR